MSSRAFGVSVVAALCSGCVGFAFHGNEHHRADNPILTADRAHYDGSDSSNRRFPVPTKNQVLAAWGKPDRIEMSSQGNERWIYENGIRWNGVVLFLLIPVPLLIPVGSDYMVVEYAGDSVVAVETINNAVKSYAGCGFYAFHDIGFGCGFSGPGEYLGRQFRGGSRPLLAPNPSVEGARIKAAHTCFLE
jgi:hypothetical protein